MYTPISELIIHPTVRPQQLRSYEAIQENWNNSHSFFCSLPTGSGKTDLAACVLSEYLKLNNSTKVDIIVPFRMHQDFWQNILELYGRKHGFTVALLKGRGSYYCPIIKSGSNISPCAFDPSYARTCQARQRCPLLIARKRIRRAHVRILNWWVFKYVDLGEEKADFRVYDEAHNLLNLESLVKVEINKSLLQNNISNHTLLEKLQEWETTYLGNKYYIEINQAEGIEFLRDLKYSLNQQEEEIARKLNIDPSSVSHTILRELRKISELTNAISDLISNPKGSDTSFFLQRMGKTKHIKIVVQPFDISYIFEKLFKGSKNLFLSATLGDGNYLAKLLGLDPKYCLFIQELSSFNKSQHPFYILKEAEKLSTATEDKKNFSYNLISEQIPPLLNLIRDRNLRGLVLTSSFEIANLISKLARSQRLQVVTHTAGKSDEAIKNFIDEKKGDILITPSAWEGISLDDDLGRICLIPKLPFPMMGDPIIKKKAKKYPNFLENEVLIAIQQAHGRIQRNPTDWGVTICLDGNFHWLRSKNPKSFEPWFVDRINEGSLDNAMANIIHLSESLKTEKSQYSKSFSTSQNKQKAYSRMKQKDREWLESSGIGDLLRKKS